MTIPWLPAAQTAHNPQAVARILKTLPEWFGREEANAEYIHDAERLETWTVNSSRNPRNCGYHADRPALPG